MTLRYEIALGHVAGAVEQRGEGVQGVEPAARLVDGLADEVGGEALGEELLVLERVVRLRVGHRAGVEPRVGDLGRAAHLAAAVGAVQRHVVDERAVGVRRRRVEARALGELLVGADAVRAAALRADPERQRRAPVALARERPVDVAVEPLAEAAVADVAGDPVDVLVVRHQRVADGGGADVPRGLGVVEHRRVAAPAERVGVVDRRARQQQPSCVEIRRDVGVGLLHEPPAERPAGERAVERDGLEEHQPLGAPERVVVLAERGGDVHHARAVVGGDELRADDAARRRVARLDGLRAAVDEGERLDALPLARLVERLRSAGRQAPSPRSVRARPRARHPGARRAGARRRRRAAGRRPRRARTRRRARRRGRCCRAASTASSSTRAPRSARRRRGAVRRRPRRSCRRRGA